MQRDRRNVSPAVRLPAESENNSLTRTSLFPGVAGSHSPTRACCLRVTVTSSEWSMVPFIKLSLNSQRTDESTSHTLFISDLFYQFASWEKQQHRQPVGEWWITAHTWLRPDRPAAGSESSTDPPAPVQHGGFWNTGTCGDTVLVLISLTPLMCGLHLFFFLALHNQTWVIPQWLMSPPGSCCHLMFVSAHSIQAHQINEVVFLFSASHRGLRRPLCHNVSNFRAV